MMVEFLQKAKKDLKSETKNAKIHVAIDALFDLSEDSLTQIHQDVTPDFCHDVLMVSNMIKEMIHHV